MTAQFRRVALRLRPHRVFVALFVLGVVLRALLVSAAWPGFFMWGDSYGYLQDAAALRPGTWRPIGYGAFLRVATTGLHQTWVVIAAQHLLGLLAAVLVYRLALRLRARPWVAAVAAAPVLLGVFELTVEHALMADTVFLVLLLGALSFVLRPAAPSTGGLVFAGILLAGAALTRTVGLPVLVLVLAFGFIRRWGARRVVTFAAAAFLPVVAYAIAYDATNGRFTVQGESGIELYGRVQATLPCGDVRVPRIEKPLCVPRAFPPRTPALKQGVTYFTWDSRSPVWSSLRAPTTQQQARLAADYAKRLVRAHPARYLSSVVHFTALYFDPVDPTGPAVWPVATWTLHRQLHPAQTHLLLAADATDRVTPPRTLDGAAPQKLGGGMIPLVAYQSIGRVPGPLLALALLLGLLLPVVSRRVPEQVRWSVCLLAACGLAMVVVPAATVAVSYRYLVPVIATAWPAGVVAAGALHDARRRRTGRHAMTRVGRAPDPQPAGVG